jgi:hypothetical protein
MAASLAKRIREGEGREGRGGRRGREEGGTTEGLVGVLFRLMAVLGGGFSR